MSLSKYIHHNKPILTHFHNLAKIFFTNLITNMQIQNSYTPVNFEGSVKFKRASLFSRVKLCSFEVPHEDLGQIRVSTKRTKPLQVSETEKEQELNSNFYTGSLWFVFLLLAGGLLSISTEHTPASDDEVHASLASIYSLSAAGLVQGPTWQRWLG